MGNWEPGVSYNYGDVVTYQGADYSIIQPHRSQSDWTPPVTPALWGRMSGGSSGGYGYGNQDCMPDHQTQQQQPTPPPPPPQSWQSQQAAPPSQSWQTQQQPQQVPVTNHSASPIPVYNNDVKQSNNQTHESKPQHDSDSDNEEKKHESKFDKILGGITGHHNSESDNEGEKHDSKFGKILGIAGGIAAGAALLGAGVAVYKHHESKEKAEEEKAAEQAQRPHHQSREGGAQENFRRDSSRERRESGPPN